MPFGTSARLPALRGVADFDAVRAGSSGDWHSCKGRKDKSHRLALVPVPLNLGHPGGVETSG
eukprot:scaffold178877_cov36-Tisochrysis_lutea.AAC.1